MEKIFYLSFILFAVLARGDNMNTMREESSNSNDNAVKEEEAYESFGSPVYGASNILPYSGLPVSGKSTYNYPAPPVSSLAPVPPSYAGYFTNLGLNNPYVYGDYSRYNYMQFTNPYYGYGPSSPNALGYGSALYPGLGYGGLASSYYGRSAYPIGGYSYPAYGAGLRYRYGGLNYAPGAVKGGAVARAAAPVYGIPPPVPRGPVPIASIPPPVAAYSAPVLGPLPAVSPYRSPPVRTVQNKDGSVRYAYTPSDVQNLQAF